MLYMVYCVDKPNAVHIREGARDAHFKYMEQNAGIMVLGGATLTDDGAGRTGSVLIINVPDRAAADRFADNEPFHKAGLFERHTVTRMRRGQWTPANAPKTAEGN